MSLPSRREYLEKIRGRYARAGRVHKSRILDEFCFNCGYHRKHAVRVLSQTPRPRKKPGPRRRYGEETVALLKTFWLVSDQMCSKRLKAAAPDWVNYLQAPLVAKRELLAMSPATMDRLLRPIWAKTTLWNKARVIAQKAHSHSHRLFRHRGRRFSGS